MNNKYKILNFEILNINIGNKKVIVELIFQNIGIINQKIKIYTSINLLNSYMEISNNNIIEFFKISEDFIKELQFPSSKTAEKLINIILSGIIKTELLATNIETLNNKENINDILKYSIYIEHIKKPKEIIINQNKIKIYEKIENSLIDIFKETVEECILETKEKIKYQLKEIINSSKFYDKNNINTSLNQLYKIIEINIKIGKKEINSNIGFKIKEDEIKILINIEIPLNIINKIQKDKLNLKKIINTVLIFNYTMTIGLLFENNNQETNFLTIKEAIIMQKLIGENIIEGEIEKELIKIANNIYSEIIEQKEKEIQNISNKLKENEKKILYLTKKSIFIIENIFQKTLEQLNNEKEDNIKKYIKQLGKREEEYINGYFTNIKINKFINNNELKKVFLKSIDGLLFLKEKTYLIKQYYKETTSETELKIIKNNNFEENTFWKEVIYQLKLQKIDLKYQKEIEQFIGKWSIMPQFEFLVFYHRTNKKSQFNKIDRNHLKKGLEKK